MIVARINSESGKRESHILYVSCCLIMSTSISKSHYAVIKMPSLKPKTSHNVGMILRFLLPPYANGLKSLGSDIYGFQKKISEKSVDALLYFSSFTD